MHHFPQNEDRKSKAIWLVPLIFGIWINAHGSWLLGMILFVLYLVPGWYTLHAGAFEQTKRDDISQGTLLLVLLLSVAALFANPYGWHMVWNPFDMIFKQKLNISIISEWFPLSLESAVGKCVVAIIGIMLASAFLKARKWKVYEALWILFACYSAFDHLRFTFLAGVVIAPFFAADISKLIWKESASKEKYAANVLFAVAGVCFMVYLIAAVARDNAKALSESVPDPLINMVQPSWRTMNQYELGGRFAFDGKKDFVDSRVDTFEHAGVFADYIDAIRVKKTFEILDKYKIDHILFKESEPFTYLVEHSSQWSVIRRDRDWVLIERRR